MAKCSSFLDGFGLSAVANNISSFVGDHKIGSVGGRKIIPGRTRDKEDVEQRPMQADAVPFYLLLSRWIG